MSTDTKTPEPVPAASEVIDDDPFSPQASPRRRLIAKVTLTLFSLYVAMIWLLALDQQFHWGIFKP